MTGKREGVQGEKKRGLVPLVLTCCAILLVAAAPASASKRVSLHPVVKKPRALVFNASRLDPAQVRVAKARLHQKAGKGHSRLRTRKVTHRVRRAARQDGTFRLASRKGGIKKGHVNVVVDPPTTDPTPTDPTPTDPTPTDPPTTDPTPTDPTPTDPTPTDPTPTSCAVDPATLTAAGCKLIFDDTSKVTDAGTLWGKTDCQTSTRHKLIDNGDPHLTGLGTQQAGSGARQLTVLDGDDVWGERCELGENWRKSTPMPTYKEGDHKITFLSLRLPSNYPLSSSAWQVVMQMKQIQPANNGSGTPILSMKATKGRWSLMQSNSAGASNDSHEVWSTPASQNQWTRFAYDVNYSQDPAQGSITVYADLNGDGDALDSGETSPTFKTYTLKVETSGGSDDGVAPGESIQSHLRTGVYHDTSVVCATSTNGCSTQVDNVQIVG